MKFTVLGLSTKVDHLTGDSESYGNRAVPLCGTKVRFTGIEDKQVDPDDLPSHRSFCKRCVTIAKVVAHKSGG